MSILRRKAPLGERVLKFHFGREGLRKVLDICASKQVDLSDALLDWLVGELYNRGYSKDSIGQTIFEDALDFQCRAQHTRIRTIYKVYKGVPKHLRFKISVPKVI